MYTEEKSGFPVKDLLLKMLLLTIFMGLLIWIYPMPKGNVDLNVDIDPLIDRIFIENIKLMQDTATTYYTNERLPKELGDKKSMTLKEMLDKKMILPFVDKNGDSCDVNNSYVEVTRMETEFILKVYLECGQQKDYVLVNLGCNNKCFILKKPADKVAEKPKPKPQPKPKDKPKEEAKKTTEYQYKRAVSSESWSPFSDWTDEVKVEEGVITETREILIGRQWSADPVYKYEYEKTIYGEWSDWSSYSTTREQTYPGLKEEQTRIVQEPKYGAWVTGDWTTKVLALSDTREKVDEKFVKYSNWSLWSQKCYAILQDQYNSNKTIERQGPIDFGTNPTNGTLCYVYNVRTRSIINRTYYKYRECTKTLIDVTQYSYMTRPFVSKTIRDWFTSTPSSEWKPTGNRQQISDNGRWIDDKKKQYRYSYKKVDISYEYMWSTKKTLPGWERTGKSRILPF